MFAIAALGTVTVAGLAVVVFLAVRMVVQLRRLRAQIARTRQDLGPRYERVRQRSERVRVDVR